MDPFVSRHHCFLLLPTPTASFLLFILCFIHTGFYLAVLLPIHGLQLEDLTTVWIDTAL